MYTLWDLCYDEEVFAANSPHSLPVLCTIQLPIFSRKRRFSLWACNIIIVLPTAFISSVLLQCLKTSYTNGYHNLSLKVSPVVTVTDMTSAPKRPHLGVSQTSVLGPLLFVHFALCYVQTRHWQAIHAVLPMADSSGHSCDHTNWHSGQHSDR